MVRMWDFRRNIRSQTKIAAKYTQLCFLLKEIVRN